MACLYLSRSRITDNEGIADILFRIYQNYAPDASFIYTFRTWILDYSKFSKDGNALEKVWSRSKEEGDMMKFGGGFYCAKVTPV